MDTLATSLSETTPPSTSNIIRILKWDDIFDRPNHLDLVHAHHEDLVQIIGRYEGLKPFRPCGLKSCRSAHGTGYLITLKDGVETHIGHNCGETHFGVEAFKSIRSSFKKALNEKTFRENISVAIEQVPGWRKQLTDLRYGGPPSAETCYHKMHRQMGKLFDEMTENKLRRLASTGNGWITKQVKVDSDQSQMTSRGMYSNSNYITENVYLVAGIKAVSTYRQLAPRKFDKYLTELKLLENLDLGSLSAEDLKLWNRKVGQMERTIQTIREVVEDCARFLLNSNIENINRHKHLL